MTNDSYDIVPRFYSRALVISHPTPIVKKALSTDSIAALLGPWGFDSVDSLKDAIVETTGYLTVATERGHTEIVAEESEKLSGMQSLLSDVLNASSNSRNAHASSLHKTTQSEGLMAILPVRH